MSSFPPNPTHELNSSFLYLTTASIAVKNTKAQIKSTTPYVCWSPVTNDYYANLKTQEQLDGEEEELKKWEERFVQAGLQIVDCVAKRETGRWLPAEILGIVGGFLREDGMVLKKIW
ncbi:hypothetical protein ABVK25_003822 [Lepraria finkii]|uniref:Uncharacterized protein n=1 Tax=Lepraria finkii TaxID=1340010 RepID=A0ABR4BHA8_9LECA